MAVQSQQQTFDADPNWKTILIAVLAIELVGFAIGGAFGPEPGGWYFQIEKSALNPPPWAFPIAWTLIYAAMGLAVARVWAAQGAPGRTAALALFGLQLALNYAWSPVFFGLQAFWPAVWLNIALLVAAVAAMIATARVDRLAGALMGVNAAWVGFAAFLSYEVARLNP